MYGYQALLEPFKSTPDWSETGVLSLFDAVAEWLAVPYLLDRYGLNAPKELDWLIQTFVPMVYFSLAMISLLYCRYKMNVSGGA